MIAKLLSEALTILKTAAADIGVPLAELTADQLEQYQTDCFNKKRLTNDRILLANSILNAERTKTR